MNVRDMEVLAPTGSIELQQYQRTKTYDFSSGVEGARTYEMVTISQGQTVKIIFEPNKTIFGRHENACAEKSVYLVLTETNLFCNITLPYKKRLYKELFISIPY